MRKLDPSVVLSALSVVIAVGAMAISVRGCRQADEAVRLSRLEFEETRLTALTGTLDGDTLKIAATNSETSIDTIWFVPPAAIFPNRMRVQDGSINLKPFLPAIAAYLRRTGRFDDRGMYAGTIPVGIELFYYTRSDLRIDYQQYLLFFRGEAGRIHPEHLSFVARFKSKAELTKALANLETGVSIYGVQPMATR